MHCRNILDVIVRVTKKSPKERFCEGKFRRVEKKSVSRSESFPVKEAKGKKRVTFQYKMCSGHWN